jgi:hypothetical protein
MLSAFYEGTYAPRLKGSGGKGGNGGMQAELGEGNIRLIVHFIKSLTISRL